MNSRETYIRLISELKIDKADKRQLYKHVLAMKQALVADAVKCENPVCEETQNLTVDHIVPMAILQDMGYDRDRYWDEENMQVLCMRCNKYKNNRLDFSNKKTKPILLKYLNEIN